MKNLNFKIIMGALFLIIASISCTIPCDDDDDYSRDLKPKEAVSIDSLKVASQHHNET